MSQLISLFINICSFISWCSVGGIDTRAATNKCFWLIAQSWTTMRNFNVDQSDCDVIKKLVVCCLQISRVERKQETFSESGSRVGGACRCMHVWRGQLSITGHTHRGQLNSPRAEPDLPAGFKITWNVEERWRTLWKTGRFCRCPDERRSCDITMSDRWEPLRLQFNPPVNTEGRSFTVGQWLTCSLFGPSDVMPSGVLFSQELLTKTNVEKQSECKRVDWCGHTWGVNMPGRHRVTFTDHCFTCITKESMNAMKLPVWKTIHAPLGEGGTHFDTKNNLISQWKRQILIVFYLVCSNSVDLNSQQSYFKFGHSRNQMILRNVTTF